MADRENPEENSSRKTPRTPVQSREARLAEALRANLRRRKAAPARDGGGAGESSDD